MTPFLETLGVGAHGEMGCSPRMCWRRCLLFSIARRVIITHHLVGARPGDGCSGVDNDESTSVLPSSGFQLSKRDTKATRATRQVKERNTGGDDLSEGDPNISLCEPCLGWALTSARDLSMRG